MNELKQSYFILERNLAGRWTDGTPRAHDPYVCMFCRPSRVEFPTSEELRDHSIGHHRGLYNEHHCFICNARFGNKNRTTKHIDLVHKKLRPFRCLRCGKCYYASHDLLRHVQREHEQVKYKCQDCPMEFRGDCELRSHYLKTHRCRIKFKGILGPEIEFVIPMSKNAPIEPPTSRIKSTRIMERIKMKYEAATAVVVKQERLVWNDGERRVAKKSTGGKKLEGAKEKPFRANRVNIIPSLSKTSNGNLAKKSTTKMARSSSSQSSPDENSPTSQPQKAVRLAKKSTGKSTSPTSAAGPSRLDASAESVVHGSRVKICASSSQSSSGSQGLVVQQQIANEASVSSTKSGGKTPEIVDLSDKETASDKRKNSSTNSSQTSPSGSRGKKMSGSPNKTVLTYQNTEYTLMTPNIILDPDSPPPPPMKTEPEEEIERKLTLYGCLYCQRKCANVELVMAHLSEKHGITMEKDKPVSYHWSLSYLCTHCDEAFEEEDKVEEHLLTHNSDLGFCYEGAIGIGGRGSSINYDDMSDCIVLD